MGRKLPKHTVEAIEFALLNSDDSKEAIATDFNVSYETVRYIARRIRVNKIAGLDTRKSNDRPSVITPEIEQAVTDWLIVRSDLFQDEVADYVYEDFGVKLSQSMVSRMLKKLNISHKRLEYITAQRSQPLVDDWLIESNNWTASQLVFLDESASNERNGRRKYSWAPVGKSAKARRWLKSSEKWSVLPAYTLEGYITAVSFQGSITAEMFEEWVATDVLPSCNPYPLDRSILMLDNCSIHRKQQLEVLCEEKGVLLKFLPPYCPFLNPIEESFHDLKAWIRRNYSSHIHVDYSFEEFLHIGVETVGKRGSPRAVKNAHGHFRHTGYKEAEYKSDSDEE